MYEQSMGERGWAGADPEGVVYIGGAAGIRGGLGGAAGISAYATKGLRDHRTHL